MAKSKLKTTTQTSNYANLRKAGFGPNHAAQKAVEMANAPPMPVGPQPTHTKRNKAVVVPVLQYGKK